MIKDIEKHLIEAIDTSNRNFFNKYLEHEMTLTRNIIADVMIVELTGWMNDWHNIVANQIAEADAMGISEESLYPGGTPWFTPDVIKKAAQDGVSQEIIDKAKVITALGSAGTIKGFKPTVNYGNQYQIVITFHKGEFTKLKKGTTKGGKTYYINQVADALVKLYQNARSEAFNILEAETIRAGHGKIHGTNPLTPGRTAHTSFTKSGRERGKLIRAHGKAKLKGGQLVAVGTDQTTVALLSVVKEWRKFTKGKIKTNVSNKKVLGMMGQVRKEFTDALDMEYNITKYTKHPKLGGIKDEQKVNIHVTDAKGNYALAHFDKKAIQQFLKDKSEDIQARMVKKYAHLQPDLQQSPTFKRRAVAQTQKILIEKLLGIKGTRPDFRLKVNKRLLKEGKNLLKNERKTKKGKRAGKNNLQKTIVKAAAATAGTKLRRKPKGRSSVTAQTAPSPIALRNLLNEYLPQMVASKMTGAPTLQYRTGRFANSARVDNVTVGSRGGTHIDYTYMRDPYETFEPGNKQGSTQRDPRKLIGESIRELAIGILGRQPTTIRRN